MKFIIGQKIGMTRVFDESNKVTPVTLISIADNHISQIKTLDKDQYQAIQIAYGQKKNASKPVKGHLKKNQLKNALSIKEFPTNHIPEDLKPGDEIKLTQFTIGDLVTVSSKSKGKGFSGTVKRHHFTIGPKSHGSNNQRRPGSIGATTPAHVIKGRRMPGRMGHDQTTLKKVQIVDILQDQKVFLLKGSIPGARGTIVSIWQK